MGFGGCIDGIKARFTETDGKFRRRLVVCLKAAIEDKDKECKEKQKIAS